jgi:glutamine cyclotransferase
MSGGAGIPGVFCFPLMLVRTDSFRKILLRFMVAALLFSGDHADASPIYGYRVVATFPHSTESYTEGFFYVDGIFYEGIGINGHSAILAVAPETGRILHRHDLPPEYFGEGSLIGVAMFTSGPGSRTSVSSMTDSACKW